MNKRRACSLLFVSLTVLFAYVPCSWATGCDSIVVPSEVKAILEKEYTDWRVVFPESLSSPDDQRIWTERYSSECPGIIRGHFTSHKIGYAVNLVRGNGKTLEQQILFFEPAREGFRKRILDPPSHVGVVTVLHKFAPGVYKSLESGRSLKIGFDTIGVSEIEAGTVVFYWDGTQFQRIVTSI